MPPLSSSLGLPAPECSDNPLGYKFSWSPRGALLNMLSGARFLQDGQIVDIEENGGLLDATTSMDFLPGFSLEGEGFRIMNLND